MVEDTWPAKANNQKNKPEAFTPYKTNNKKATKPKFKRQRTIINNINTAKI